MNCRYCGGECIKAGTREGRQRYRCKACRVTQFAEVLGTGGRKRLNPDRLLTNAERIARWRAKRKAGQG